MTVTAEFGGGAGELVCRTRDVSRTGLFLETPVTVDVGTEVRLSLLDEERGIALRVDGVVARLVDANPAAGGPGMGIRLAEASEQWNELVDRANARQRASTLTQEIRVVRRLRILVVGDEARRRGALALYVTSGWDVRFASDGPTAEEALQGFRIDAVIAEHDLGDVRWREVLETARRVQPQAKRLVRAPLTAAAAAPLESEDLVDRVVDLDAGMDALLAALTE
jgi:CheY-like chemotaxis protein